MSNTSIGLAKKGSKLAIQRLSLPQNSPLLNNILCDKLEWISPKEADDYKEYRMNSPVLLNMLGVTKELKDKYFKLFWPSPQPEWDGIAKGENNKLYLFEAKSHFSEIVPSKDKNPVNDRMKYESIMSTASRLFNIEDTPINRKIWCNDYYQISNRITFQQRLLDISKSNNINYDDVIMVFLNFINDRTWEKEKLMVCSGKDWDDYYDNHILPKMGLTRELLFHNGILLINLNIDSFLQ